MNHSRRRFLTGLAATGAAALLPDGRFGAHAQAPTNASARRIDVHCHFSSPGFIQTIKARNTGQMPLMTWTPAKTIEDMDRDGVATSIVSTSEPS
ncbi:MAG: twin-arginine translocation signal domain-containing protein, partial [Gammaproteobacteria bacterium]